MSKKILYVVNAPRYFVSHRLPIAKKSLELGFKVHVASNIENEADVEAVRLISDLGMTYHDRIVTRGDGGVMNEVKSLVSCYLLVRRLSPDMLHLITLKPLLYGSLVARALGIKNVVAAVAGLGTLFVTSNMKSIVQRHLVVNLLRLGLKRNSVRVIFQNEQDLNDLERMGIVNEVQSRLIRGSGVPLDKYCYEPEPTSHPVVIMAARLIKEKGVLEFVEAAQILVDRGVRVEMRLLGDIDKSNPSSLTSEEYKELKCNANIVLKGYRNNIADEYKLANIVCLPSYREGLPKSLIEAAACGRAVVTTDVPGCRDAIIPDRTGVLVPVRDSIALADAIQRLIENDSLRQSMGLAGRQLAERMFDIRAVVHKHIDIYRELMGAPDDG
ncbi:glycosyltransferase family 4 protein [Pseudidiomarina salilacus]|uniref:glycosyltransferase family 4 protein n=1 Tax=Pseudidiomarina salilacus TaxID=3384452 RepID=UPI003984F14F